MKTWKSISTIISVSFIAYSLVACIKSDSISPTSVPPPKREHLELILGNDTPTDLLTRSTTNNLAQKRYVAAGTRAYVVGDMSGSFPPMGWHIPGEMGGIWAHPIKLLDGYWFALDGKWLPPAYRFTSGMGYIHIEHPETNGLELTRIEFAPDDLPVVLIGLSLINTRSEARSVELSMDVRSDILLTYPWGWSRPLNTEQFNENDEGIYDTQKGRLVFQEPGKPWFAMIASSEDVVSGDTGPKFWGQLNRSEQRAHSQHGKGMGGQLALEIEIPGMETRTVWFAIGGSHTSRKEADAALTAALVDPVSLLSEKINSRRSVLEMSQVDLPDDALEDAFEWSKLNLADLTFEVTNVQIRDTDQGNAYPSPILELPTMQGVAAGFPDYYEFFGNDGAYTVYALVASGMWETAMDHLRTVRDVSRAVNGETGKVVHEVMSDGSVYFGTIRHPGNSNETAQFAMAVELLWRWSGDDGFRDEMYDFVRDGLRYVTTVLDANGDYCPEGFGMIEREGMAQQKLDVSMYTWQALVGLRHMASSKGDNETVNWAESTAGALQQNLENWWIPGEKLYSDSIENCLESFGQKQQRHWIIATPLEIALAPKDRALDVLGILESNDFTGDTGLYHTGLGGGPDGRGETKVWTLPNSVMAVAEANYGRVNDNQALLYMRAIAGSLDLEMPGALPEILPSQDYDPFADMGERAMFMQAWSSYGVQWPIINHFLGVRPNVPTDSLYVVPQMPPSWSDISIQNLRVGGGSIDVSVEQDESRYMTMVSAPAGWSLIIGHTLPTDAEIEAVTLDGAEIAYEIIDTPRGHEIRVKTTTDATHTLVIIVKP